MGARHGRSVPAENPVQPSVGLRCCDSAPSRSVAILIDGDLELDSCGSPAAAVLTTGKRFRSQVEATAMVAGGLLVNGQSAEGMRRPAKLFAKADRVRFTA